MRLKTGESEETRAIIADLKKNAYMYPFRQNIYIYRFCQEKKTRGDHLKTAFENRFSKPDLINRKCNHMQFQKPHTDAFVHAKCNQFILRKKAGGNYI